ncbi:MAG TPA: NADPH-dependent FMN reductase [Sandaracinaceae bacterium LLY-WYZ-13_1]|nr:NADPH-dependent FMN reductase [Sandaracinaceae bacterium LLY-WYZ-13_1]
MTTLLGIAGSLRAGSLNRKLLQAATERTPDGVTLEIGSIAGIPLYDGDAERDEGVPAPVEALKDRIAAADGLLLVTPEYNQSIPGVFKNAIDWCSRPPKDIARVFAGKPVGVIGATPGRGGTRAAQDAWLSVFRGLSLVPFLGESLYVAGAAKVFDDDGALTDDTIARLLTEYLEAFAAFTARVGG